MALPFLYVEYQYLKYSFSFASQMLKENQMDGLVDRTLLFCLVYYPFSVFASYEQFPFELALFLSDTTVTCHQQLYIQATLSILYTLIIASFLQTVGSITFAIFIFSLYGIGC